MAPEEPGLNFWVKLCGQTFKRSEVRSIFGKPPIWPTVALAKSAARCARLANREVLSLWIEPDERDRADAGLSRETTDLVGSSPQIRH